MDDPQGPKKPHPALAPLVRAALVAARGFEEQMAAVAEVMGDVPMPDGREEQRRALEAEVMALGRSAGPKGES